MIEQKLKNVLANQLGLESDKISLTSHLVHDLNADSLDLVETVMAIEAEFDVQIDEDEYHNAETIGQIIVLLENKLASK